MILVLKWNKKWQEIILKWQQLGSFQIDKWTGVSKTRSSFWTSLKTLTPVHVNVKQLSTDGTKK